MPYRRRRAVALARMIAGDSEILIDNRSGPASQAGRLMGLPLRGREPHRASGFADARGNGHLERAPHRLDRAVRSRTIATDILDIYANKVEGM